MCTQNQFTVQMFMKPVYSTDLENWKSWQLKERKKGEHTCPEVLIKLSELIKGLSINTNYNLAIISVFTVFKYCNRYVLTNSNSLINASGQVWELGREHSPTTDYRFSSCYFSQLKNLALEANKAMCQGGLLYKGGLQGKISNLCKTLFWDS